MIQYFDNAFGTRLVSIIEPNTHQNRKLAVCKIRSPYTDGCSCSERKSYRCVDRFYDELLASSGGGPVTKTHHYHKHSTKSASKNDFSINGAVLENIDFMKQVCIICRADKPICYFRCIYRRNC